MGKIHDEVLNGFLRQYPDLNEMLGAFLHAFDVSYGDKKEISNTVVFVFMLKPEKHITEAFGLEKEVLLIYTPYDELQPRAFQAAHTLFNMHPFQGRVDSLNCLFVSKDERVMEHKGIKLFGDDSSHVFVPIRYSELVSNRADTWYIKNILRDNFFDVDLFGYTLPLREESSFFGRQQLVARYIDSVRRCENKGIFGVRKVGKTSLLFKIERVIREQRIGFVFFYDCKSPSYRKMHWNEFLGSICDNIAKRLNLRIRREYDALNIIKSFRFVMKEASIRSIKIVIMFDEIEYVSFKSPIDPHWKTEFIDFWQTLWSIQSIHRNLVFIISGVNPSVTEIDTIGGIQNPLFGIVQSEYLQGLTSDDTHNMIRTLGKRMGLRFDFEAIEFLYKQYNGHPMLTRLACSYINRECSDDKRPIDIGIIKIKQFQNDIDTELAYYFKHIVSEIQQFYPEEYEMFELLASGQTSDFIELSALSEFVKHLYSYGLIEKDENNIPKVKMPVAGRYVATELARKENRKSLYKVIEKEKRSKWITQRVGVIIRDLRELETAIHIMNLPKLFGENSFPEAEKFAIVTPVLRKSDFENFINTCNRCFVESVENYGCSINKQKYLWSDIKLTYPALFATLERIKVYRHFEDHLRLKPEIAKKYKEFWQEDTEGISDVDEQFFCVQQRLIEGMLTNIQVELSKIG